MGGLETARLVFLDLSDEMPLAPSLGCSGASCLNCGIASCLKCGVTMVPSPKVERPSGRDLVGPEEGGDLSPKVQGEVECFTVHRNWVWKTKRNKIMGTFLEHKGAGAG